MTEYWVSKKQYWCKYCSIFIRDDAPSRRQHETGLRHIGNRERYIRDLYKGRNAEDKEKALEAAEIARIERTAAAAHALDGPSGSSTKPSLLAQLEAKAKAAVAAPSKKPPPVDKFANYSSAAQLGFEDPGKSQYEMQQDLKSSIGEAGEWETVEVPAVASAPSESEEKSTGKRKLGGTEGHNEDTDFKFQHRDKRPVHDPYDNDDYDPRAVLGSLRVKVKAKAEKGLENAVTPNGDSASASGPPALLHNLDRAGWTGKIELQASGSLNPSETVNRTGGGWVKVDTSIKDEVGNEDQRESQGTLEDSRKRIEGDIEPAAQGAELLGPSEIDADENKPSLDELSREADSKAIAHPGDGVGTPNGAGTLFKKRRPPPGGGRKR